MSFVASFATSSTKVPSLGGRYPLGGKAWPFLRYYGPIRHPTRPGSCPRGPPVEDCSSSPGTSRVDVGVLACMLSPIPRRNPRALVIDRHQHRLCDARTAAFPMMSVGRLPHQSFRGLLRRSTCYGLHARGAAEQPFPSRASAVWLPARLSRLLPGAMTTSRTGLSPAGLQHPFHGARHPPFSQLSRLCYAPAMPRTSRSAAGGVGTS